MVLLALALLWRDDDSSSTEAGQAPTFSTRDLQGRPVRLADYRGRIVLVNFWASWCVPCRREFPILEQLHGDRVTVLGVVFRDEPRSAAAFMREQGATWPGLLDPGGRIAEAYGVGARPGIPVTVAVSADGRLAGRRVGEASREDFELLVSQAS